jgi:ABC-type amino acid transport substrate-binding protein
VFKRIAALLLCMAFAVLCVLPSVAPAEPEVKTIRVGWYDTPFNHKDTFGRRTGYAYEYQRKIAAYTGWKYQYVEGTWSELLQMLKDGRIDLMSDVSYKEDRTEYLLYSAIPMGSEIYYLYVTPENNEMSIENDASLNEKKVGVTASSVQRDFFLAWEEEHGINADLVGLECSEEDYLAMLKRGELDAFITLDTYGNPESAVPLWKIGTSDFYFAVSKTRPDLLAVLNVALNRIQDENKYYSEELSAKYLTGSGTNRYLTADEKKWLEGHGPIRVGYQDSYLAFCAADPKTGELTGALKDYLELASDSMENARPEFEPVAFPTADAALEALKSGEIDCMFPANLTDYDGEIAGVVMTAPLMVTEMDAIVRAEDRQDILRRSQVRVGVNRGNPNYELFLREHFPGWTPVLFADTPSCLDAVGERNADCIIVSNYRFNDIAAQCSRLNLAAVYTGVDMDYCFAVREGNTILYSVLSRMIRQVPESSVNAALTYYSASGKSEASGQIPMVPALVVPAVIIAALLFVVLAQSRRLRALKKAPEKAPGPAEES